MFSYPSRHIRVAHQLNGYHCCRMAPNKGLPVLPIVSRMPIRLVHFFINRSIPRNSKGAYIYNRPIQTHALWLLAYHAGQITSYWFRPQHIILFFFFPLFYSLIPKIIPYYSYTNSYFQPIILCETFSNKKNSCTILCYRCY